MKQLLSLLLLMFVITTGSADAQVDVPNLGRPGTLLKEAKQGRKELLEVLLRLKDNVRELRDQPTFDEFFALLGPLDALAKEYNLALIYPDAVKEVGKNMIMHGNRWLKISVDSDKKILSYQKWADLSAALLFQGQVIEELNKIKDEELFKKAYVNLLSLETWAEVTFPNDLYLYPTYQKTISDLSFKALLTTKIIDQEEWTFWIRGLSSQSAAQDYLSFLNEKILMDSLKKEEIPQWFALAETLGKQLTAIDRLSGSVKNNYGVFVTDLTAKAIFYEYDINEASFKTIVNLLDISSLRGLIFRWVNPEKTASDVYALRLVTLSKILYLRTKELKLTQNSLELERFVSSRLGPVVASQNGIEGHYNLKGLDGREWFFTIIRETESRVVASLCDSTGVICFSFFNIQYNMERNVFFASENLPNDDSYQNAPAQIIFGADNTVSLDLPHAFKVSGRFSGKKVQSYENIMSMADENAVAIEGHFKGTMEVNGVLKEYDLMITSFGEYSIGRLESEDSVIRVDLNKGTDGKAGFIYLTSGRTGKGTWFHLRLKQEGYETLVGDAIVGGMGKLGKVRFVQYYGDDE
ncbi:hypothetical protein SHI21_18175 [Bacteriovorax sp. PP10]|uniref:Uncharacterized protein n=1 Tax=Bacteriovorax antarcticus TaxID=3088717 RepID=A0ABU5VYX8_9BACT|nr:hypothetical protein [Bacteriovorax sp. PP10]MEA9358167.1 hypothetical protein [Bacteriovorax sp. PP10]